MCKLKLMHKKRKILKKITMKKNLKVLVFISLTIACFIVLLPIIINANNEVVGRLTIHLQGVDKAKVSIIPLTGHNPIEVVNVERSRKGKAVTIPDNHIPGEFLLKFEFQNQKTQGRPLSNEKMIIMGFQNVELFVNPLHINNPDSTYFLPGEKENALFLSFMKKNMHNNEMLELLHGLLSKYDERDSDFYKLVFEEYERRRLEHNSWIENKINNNKELFVSSLFQLYYIPAENWQADRLARQMSKIKNYFSGIDFNDTLLLRSASLRTWMDQYVNMHIEVAESRNQIDSLFVLAGFNAIEQAKKGHPLFYGWMVDYFFTGYESLDIQKGIAMLAPYIADENCLTNRRQEIDRRIRGITTLVPGTPAPDFSFNDKNREKISFWEYQTAANYKLVLFWSAGCPHCVVSAKQLYKWYESGDNKSKVEVFAISLDESEEEVEDWKKLKKDFKGWNHILAQGGVNSREAYSYFILSTPTMFVIEPETNTISALPSNVNELIKALK